VKHPLVGLSLVVIFLALFTWLGPRVWRNVRLPLVALRAWIAGRPRGEASAIDAGAENVNALPGALLGLSRSAAPIPPQYAQSLGGGARQGTRVAASSNIGRLRHSIGYLVWSGEELVFVTRRGLRYRTHRISLSGVHSAEWRRGLLMNRLVLSTAEGEKVFYVFKDVAMADAASDSPIAPRN
jgi:hypothetical protein